MEQIKGTVESLLSRLEAKSQKNEFPRGSPEELLKKVFTRKEQEQVRFGYFRNGTLGIRVSSSSWMYYFNIKKEKVLAAVRSVSPAVKEIRFSLGDLCDKPRMRETA
ncbi:MAG: DciA family protein [Candidatus Omnitrophica bacterium]|nr:DciA family protein [Candidatus Omnitrophota bacterium]